MTLLDIEDRLDSLHAAYDGVYMMAPGLEGGEHVSSVLWVLNRQLEGVIADLQVLRRGPRLVPVAGVNQVSTTKPDNGI